jgi:hypothetical protein
VLTLRGLVTYYVLFFIHLKSRRVDIAGITVHPARDTNLPGHSAPSLRQVGWNPVGLPVRSPNLNAYSERRVRSVNEECLSKMLLIGERIYWRITMRSVIIRGRTTSCCFLVTRKRDEAGLCNVAKGWAGCCYHKKLRNLAEIRLFSLLVLICQHSYGSLSCWHRLS